MRLALSLVARKRDSGQTRVQTREALFALLDDEVWQPLDQSLRSLVAAAALMPAPTISTLVAAGYADARAGMTSVFARVPFITAIDDNAFTIHDLFRDFVTSHASSDSSSREGAVANRIGSALVAGGNPADGLRLLVAAGRVDDVQAVLAEHAFDLLETGQRGVINAAMTFWRAGTERFRYRAGNPRRLGICRRLGSKFDESLRSGARAKDAAGNTQRGLAAVSAHVCEPRNVERGARRVTAARERCIDLLEDRLEVQAMAATFIAAAGTRPRAAVEATILELEGQISSVQPNVQVRLLRNLGNAAFYNGDPERAERLSLDAASLATELGMDTFAALAYSTLYSVAARNDPMRHELVRFRNLRQLPPNEPRTPRCVFMRFGFNTSLPPRTSRARKRSRSNRRWHHWLTPARMAATDSISGSRARYSSWLSEK